MNIRLATAADIPAILALERESSSAAHWTESQYQKFFESEINANSQRLLLLMDEESTTLSPQELNLHGFLIAHQIDREWELENIAVASAARRKCLATRLVQELCRRAREANSESIFLEVRESNQSARSFYEKLGFIQTGRRKAYYRAPAEDAILYRRTLR
jgi:ribosomal-protein-alanine N-acetyltransferase